MAVGSPLERWAFLVGEWRGTAAGQFGETGEIENVAVVTREPGERFLLTRGEARTRERVLNRSLAVMFHDAAAGRFRRETFFSYGFVNHETEFARTDAEVRFDVRMEPVPRDFEGLRWRSFLRRLSEEEIETGLEAAKGDGPFAPYGVLRLRRVRP